MQHLEMTRISTVVIQSLKETMITLKYVSPLQEINFSMVTGFSLHSMHTLYVTFKRRLEGAVSFKNEGKLKSAHLEAVDKRLELFSACKPIEFDKHENWLVVLTTTRTMIKFLYSVLSFFH